MPNNVLQVKNFRHLLTNLILFDILLLMNPIIFDDEYFVINP